MSKNIYILSGSRTPMGAYGGLLSTISAPELGAIAIQDALKKANIPAETIESIVMGNVLSANLGQAPARQASKIAGLPDAVCATTVNKVCASGMKAISMIYNDIYVGNISVGIAGGMENMSQVPHYLPNARFGIGYGNASCIDGLAKDGLTDVYNKTSMGVSGDLTAAKYKISREEQDDFAEQSYRRSTEAWGNGSFIGEVVPVNVPQRKGEALVITEDETYKKANFEKMRQLNPAFSPNGTVTAANASPMNDGASALVLAAENFVKQHQITPKARIIAYAEAEQDPTFFTTTPVLATQKVLKKANLTIEDIDFYEVNEAFAVVPMALMKELHIPHEKVNVFGGAVALGHPLGSSGSRIVVSLLNILSIKKARYGLATICNGGGGASAIIIENLL
ncbi:thiolase family protein [Flavobacterium sufflavum]|uniref:acetyl-CoA C-acetyltransferase n=1 Tax=Flavobacterium sufflavum TaxID=1921138 RepID=A0A437KK59_9FLAO|nr:thiolase family protein [Flavobacterium sufflavum]RVT70990.1 thiolase family protein [Flavobacterium sufflavum]